MTEALRQLPDEDEQGDADGVAMYAAEDVEAGEDSDEEEGEEEAGGSGAGASALVCPRSAVNRSVNETVPNVSLALSSLARPALADAVVTLA